MLKPEAEVEVSQARVSTITGFWQAFFALGQKVRAPVVGVTGEDMGIIKNLLRKHTPERLLECGEVFWQQHSQPYFDNPTHLMRLFASKLPQIERDLQ